LKGDRLINNSKSPSINMILASLFITGFATDARLIISSLLLIEIGETFNIPVGVTGQIVTAASILAIISALLMGVLTLKYNAKPLLMTGVIIYAISGLGCFLSPNFTSMLVSYSLSGIAGAMVFPMLGTLIGETLPLEERSRALGLITAGQPISYVIGSPIVAYIASAQGWRMSFVYYMLPIVMLSFLVSFVGIPKQNIYRDNNVDSWRFEGFKGVISNKSAVSCLFGALLFQASLFTVFTYIISFLREAFMISQSWATVIFSLMAVCLALGNLTVDRIVLRFGRKFSTTVLAMLLGLTTIIMYSSTSMWISLLFVVPWAYVAGAGYVSGDTLTLDQVPEFRGTLMSLNVVARSVGATIGGILGGFLLFFFDYTIFGFAMGGLGIISSVIYRLSTTE